MKVFIRFSILALALLVVASSFGEDFNKVQYFKKATPGEKKKDPIKGVLRVDEASQELVFVKGDGSVAFSVKPEKIKSIIYEKTAKPRYAAGLLIAWPLLFTKSKSHYLTIQYEGENGTGEYAIFKLDKSNFREALATIEAKTGKKIERSEES